jgi:hypothetical protein
MSDIKKGIKWTLEVGLVLHFRMDFVDFGGKGSQLHLLWIFDVAGSRVGPIVAQLSALCCVHKN